MTEKQCLKNLIEFCNKELKKTGWFIFNDHSVSLESVRLLSSYEKDANIPLPPELVFENVKINYYGIHLKSISFKWSDIKCIVIKNDRYPSDYKEWSRFQTDKYVVFALNNAEIIQVKVDKDSQYRNLLGHFIEHYKLGIGK